MLFRRISGIGFIALTVIIAIVFLYSAHPLTKGSVIILEEPNGAEFTVKFKNWSQKNKCRMALSKGDILQVETACENGHISLSVIGKNGSNPYRGSDLKSGIFTVTVSETDEYMIKIAGSKATGNLILKRSAVFHNE